MVNYKNTYLTNYIYVDTYIYIFWFLPEGNDILLENSSPSKIANRWGPLSASWQLLHHKSHDVFMRSLLCNSFEWTDVDRRGPSHQIMSITFFFTLITIKILIILEIIFRTRWDVQSISNATDMHVSRAQGLTPMMTHVAAVYRGSYGRHFPLLGRLYGFRGNTWSILLLITANINSCTNAKYRENRKIPNCCPGSRSRIQSIIHRYILNLFVRS